MRFGVICLNTEILKINADNIDQEKIEFAARILRNGGTVAFPTETVYGLGANALDEVAVRKIFHAKGRPADNPLIVHISDMKQLDRLVREIPDNAIKLAERFWPGPLTLIFKKSEIIPDVISAGLETVGIRFPSHPIAQELIHASHVPIAAPSANVSGKPSPTIAQHVIDDLMGKVDVIIDGGSVKVGVESTVLDITGGIPVLLRPGGVTVEELKSAVGEVMIDPVVLDKVTDHVIPRAPGMKYTHYSPKAQVIVVEGEDEKVIQKINMLTEQSKKAGLKVGVMAMDHTLHCYHADCILSVGNKELPSTIAANLFYTLREFDRAGVDIIYAQSVSEKGIGLAIRNRLNKAAGYNIIKV